MDIKNGQSEKLEMSGGPRWRSLSLPYISDILKNGAFEKIPFTSDGVVGSCEQIEDSKEEHKLVLYMKFNAKRPAFPSCSVERSGVTNRFFFVGVGCLLQQR